MQHVGVFFGSQSPEHDVSIITGELIISELKKMGYNPVPVYIGRQGEWYIGSELGSLSFFTASDFEEKLADSGWDKYVLDLEASRGKMLFRKKGWFEKPVTIDIAFPALHGELGEDGSIQGIFEMLGVPYVGCGVTPSAIAMDKILTKDMYKAHGIATTPYIGFSASEWAADKNAVLTKIRKELRKVVFVKPARLGSSIGISKVKDTGGAVLEEKIEVALHYDSLVIVENAVEPVVDLTCCVIGGKELKASLVQESVFNAELFDFNEKYLEDGGAQLGNAKRGLVIPANLPVDVTEHVQTMSKQIFAMIGATGIARVDWLYNREAKELFANEINPLPGTLYHHLWKASGVELSDVIAILLAEAVERKKEKTKLTRTFPSTLLASAGSMKLPSTKLQK